ncbi:hypothetical protein [Tritonibacter mobilis]|uniref:Tail tape measure protein n=1 Tax=Tritonibacter mobilis F1926 TaxID=1265309 RepID=A0A1B1A6Q0_9RHOB|nr:hypothetical protein [Tritonibacter mobilis]ANP42187.1 hypothetical protein K529_015515 [Tritonibacter mobilis F1926]KJZ22289.1 hypothetical protein TW79_18855 [Tritonibacter mobilis]
MATIASLNVGLGADSARLKRDLDKAESHTKKFGKRAARNVNKLSKSFKGLGAAMAGIAAAASIGKLLETSDAMVKSADAAGIAFDSYQRLQFGLEQSGVSSAGFQKSTLKLNKVLLDASRGSKTAADALGRIGLSFEQLDRMKPEERYAAVLRGLEGIEDKGAKAAISMELLGKEFAGRNIKTDAMLEAGKGIATISEDSARASERINDAMNRIKTSFSAVLANAIIPLIDGIRPAIDAVSNFAADNPKMASAIAGIAILSVSVGALGAAFSLLSWPVLAVTAAIAAAVAIFQNWDSIVKSTDAFLSDKFGFTLSGIIEKIQNLTGWLRDNLTPAFEIFKDGVGVVTENFTLLFGAMKDIFTLDFQSAGSKMQDAFGNVTSFFVRNFGDAFKNIVFNIKEQLTWAFESVTTSFSNFFKVAMNAALKPLENFVNATIDLLNSINPLKDISHITIGQYELGKMPQNPGWQNFNQTLGTTSGTGLTSAIMPPANNSTDAAPTTPPVTPPNSGNGNGEGFGNTASGSGGSGGSAKSDVKQEVTDSFLDSIKSSLSQALKSGDWKEFASSIFDQITGRIIDNFANGLVDGLAEGLGFGSKDGKGFFDNIFENFGKNVQGEMSTALDGSKFQGIFQNFGSGLQNMMSGIFEGIGGMFGGVGGLFGGIGGILGFSNGGVVPHKPGFSKLGVDSVPAMLQPGEVVIPTDEVDNVLNRGSGTGTTVNFNITGDISRQTEKAIFEMAPTITQMVNNTNKENGF